MGLFFYAAKLDLYIFAANIIIIDKDLQGANHESVLYVVSSIGWNFYYH